MNNITSIYFFTLHLINVKLLFQPTLLGKKKPLVAAKRQLQVFSKEQLELEALKDKIVECENKDANINDLREQLDELKEKINSLEDHKAQLISEKCSYEQAIFLQKFEHSKCLQKLMDEFEENIIEARNSEKQMKEEIMKLKKELVTLKIEHRQNILKLKDDRDNLKTSCEQLLEEQYKVLEAKTAEMTIKEKELTILEKECIALQRKHAVEIETMRKSHQLEIQDIEFDFLKTMTELQNEKEMVSHKISEIEEKVKIEIEQMRQFFNNEKLAVINESEKKMQEVSFYVLLVKLFYSPIIHLY